MDIVIFCMSLEVIITQSQMCNRSTVQQANQCFETLNIIHGSQYSSVYLKRCKLSLAGKLIFAAGLRYVTLRRRETNSPCKQSFRGQ